MDIDVEIVNQNLLLLMLGNYQGNVINCLNYQSFEEDKKQLEGKQFESVGIWKMRQLQNLSELVGEKFLSKLETTYQYFHNNSSEY